MLFAQTNACGPVSESLIQVMR